MTSKPCLHLRQWIPGDDRPLPCAVPDCPNAANAPSFKLPLRAPAPVTSAATFFQDARSYFDSPPATATYVREYTAGAGWRWVGPKDPYASRQT